MNDQSKIKFKRRNISMCRNATQPTVGVNARRSRHAGIHYAVKTDRPFGQNSDRLTGKTHAGIAERFDAVITRNDVCRRKPNPDIFLRAAQAAGGAPGGCIALEYLYDGVRAAHAVGIPGIMVADLLPPTDEMRQKYLTIFEDLHAVRAMLASPKKNLGSASGVILPMPSTPA